MTTLPVAEARANFSRLVDEAERTHERFEVTRNGRVAAILLGVDDYESLIETLEIMSNPELVEDIRRGRAELEAGDIADLDELAEAMAKRKATGE